MARTDREVESRLQEAFSAAEAVTDASEKESIMEDIGEIAARYGLSDLVWRTMEEVSSSVVRASIRVSLAENVMIGRKAIAADQVARAWADIVRAEGWKPRSNWQSPDQARCRVAGLFAAMGSFQQAQAVSQTISGPAELAKALALLARFGDGSRSSWDRARSAAGRVELAESAVEVWETLACAAAAASEVSFAREIAAEAAQGTLPGVLVHAHVGHRITLIETVANALADQGHLTDAAWVWDQATGLCRNAAADVATNRLCRLAPQLAGTLGRSAGEHLVQLAVETLGDSPLPADVQQSSPWVQVYRCVVECPELADPLRMALRRRKTLPPDWSFILGMLESRVGHLEYAERVAEGLANSGREVGTDGGEIDLEPLWLAGLLYCHLGKVDQALALMGRVLGAMRDESMVVVPLAPAIDAELPAVFSEERTIDEHFVVALVNQGELEAAIGLAHAVPSARGRAEVLWAIGQAWLDRQAPDFALEVCRSAIVAVSDAVVHAPGSIYVMATLPTRLALLQWRAGAEDEARDTLRRVHRVCLSLPSEVALSTLSALSIELADAKCPTLGEMMTFECDRRLAAVSDPALRARHILSVLVH